MDNAKPNERTLPGKGAGWSSRLEEPAALPGVGLTDKEAAWDKLYDRLRETPRRRTLPWLWAAAACLLLALVPAAFFLREKRAGTRPREPKVAIRPQPLLKPTPSRTYPAPAPPRGTPGNLPPNTLAKSTLTFNTPPPYPARKEDHRHAKAPALAPLIAKAPVHIPTDQHIPPGPNTLPGLILRPRPGQSKPMTASLQPPTPKKQLRVVHINELEPAQPTPSTAGERLRPGHLQVRFTQTETFRPATTYNNDPIDHPIIPLKHAQNP